MKSLFYNFKMLHSLCNDSLFKLTLKCNDMYSARGVSMETLPEIHIISITADIHQFLAFPLNLS